MKWTVQFHTQKVKQTISEWPLGIRAKFSWIVDLIEVEGPEYVGMPYVKPMKKGLFEIRAKGVEGIGRAFFCIKQGRIVIVLSGFIKKTDKTPAQEIEIARKRMEEALK